MLRPQSILHQACFMKCILGVAGPGPLIPGPNQLIMGSSYIKLLTNCHICLFDHLSTASFLTHSAIVRVVHHVHWKQTMDFLYHNISSRRNARRFIFGIPQLLIVEYCRSTSNSSPKCIFSTHSLSYCIHRCYNTNGHS